VLRKHYQIRGEEQRPGIFTS